MERSSEGQALSREWKAVIVILQRCSRELAQVEVCEGFNDRSPRLANSFVLKGNSCIFDIFAFESIYLYPCLCH